MSDSRDTVSVTRHDILAWRQEVLAIDGQIRALEERKGRLMSRIQAAIALFALLDDGPSIVSTPRANPRPLLPTKPGERKLHRSSSAPTFVQAVKRAVEEAPEGWRSLREVRKVIAGGELKDRLRKSDKGYYHALSRLVERKVLARHKGWLVMPYRYDAFIRAVEKGEVKPDGPIMRGGESRTGSLMGDEIYARIELLGPQSSAEIIAHLRQSREFATTVARNSSSAYNVMSRLVSRGQLKRAEGLYDIGTDNVTDTKTPSQESPREGALL